ncbi:glycoside hydrolase family 16 protein [Mycena olivaceomarginata]|nr:glycoside hydrolase family 16 protein [Mycena olivaceomarginata]
MTIAFSTASFRRSRPVQNPWTKNPNPRATVSYYLTWALLFVGAGLGGVQSYFAYSTVRIDRAPLCLVFEDEFNSGDDAAVFGGGGQAGRWLREVQMDGFGNGQFEMTTASSNNSFLLDGKLYLVPTLTNEGAPFADGTTYNSTDCTFNTTAPNAGFDPATGEFDYAGYYTACSRTTNSTAGTLINPVQSARISTLLSARGSAADEAGNGGKGKGSLCYGKVEVRAKMPKGDWLWPAIWLLPVNSTYGSWPRSGEIDMVESRGNGIRYTNRGSNYVQGALNWGPNPALNAVEKTYSWWTDRRVPFTAGWHTYTLEWTESWLRISVDSRLHTLLDIRFNQPFWKRGQFPETTLDANGKAEALKDPWTAGVPGVNGTGGNAAPFDQDFYLIMNVAVGGTNGWFPDGQGDKPWLNHAGNPMVDFIKNKAQWLPTWPEDPKERGLGVDYVRMWKHCGDP